MEDDTRSLPIGWLHKKPTPTPDGPPMSALSSPWPVRVLLHRYARRFLIYLPLHFVKNLARFSSSGQTETWFYKCVITNASNSLHCRARYDTRVSFCALALPSFNHYVLDKSSSSARNVETPSCPSSPRRQVNIFLQKRVHTFTARKAEHKFAWLLKFSRS